MSQKTMIIIAACLSTLLSLIQADVVPATCSSNNEQAMSTACSQTIQNCQDGLAGVSGSGSSTASLISISIKISIGGLLDNLVSVLSKLLERLGAIVVEILNLVLAIVVAVVNLVIKVLSGLLELGEYQSQLSELSTSSRNKVNSYSAPGLIGVVALVLNLISSLLNIVIDIKL